jgi:hypothetical protein
LDSGSDTKGGYSSHTHSETVDDTTDYHLRKMPRGYLKHSADKIGQDTNPDGFLTA